MLKYGYGSINAGDFDVLNLLKGCINRGNMKYSEDFFYQAFGNEW